MLDNACLHGRMIGERFRAEKREVKEERVHAEVEREGGREEEREGGREGRGREGWRKDLLLTTYLVLTLPETAQVPPAMWRHVQHTQC